MPPSPFPAVQAVVTPPALAARGFTLRAARARDLPWLCDLHATTRAAELAPLPWPEAQKRAFLDQQFALQHEHFVTQFPDAAFAVIEHASGQPVGRYYLLRDGPNHHLVDIALFPPFTGLGIGGALIRHSQDEAAAAGRGMRLHVQRHNDAAMRLYRRLGFRDADGTATHLLMQWRALEPAIS